MPIQTFNASNKRKCKVVLRVSSLPCDNPQASEEASHIVRGNFLRRTCTVGGSQAEKKTLRVFRTLHRVSDLCSYAFAASICSYFRMTTLLETRKALRQVLNSSSIWLCKVARWIVSKSFKAKQEPRIFSRMIGLVKLFRRPGYSGPRKRQRMKFIGSCVIGLTSSQA